MKNDPVCVQCQDYREEVSGNFLGERCVVCSGISGWEIQRSNSSSQSGENGTEIPS